MKTWFQRYHPDYFGKRGMNVYHIKKNATYAKPIAAAQLWSLIPREQMFSIAKNEGEVPVIDVRQFGYHVVLAGKLPMERPIIVKARYFTKNAEAEITRVGGRAIICD